MIFARIANNRRLLRSLLLIGVCRGMPSKKSQSMESKGCDVIPLSYLEDGSPQVRGVLNVHEQVVGRNFVQILAHDDRLHFGYEHSRAAVIREGLVIKVERGQCFQRRPSSGTRQQKI